MLKSIAAGRPVVVGDQPGWMRATVRRFDVGHVADHRSVAAFARVLIRALDAAMARRRPRPSRRLLRFHSIANFTEGWSSARRSRPERRGRRQCFRGRGLSRRLRRTTALALSGEFAHDVPATPLPPRTENSTAWFQIKRRRAAPNDPIDSGSC
jgi:hypothetical protein